MPRHATNAIIGRFAPSPTGALHSGSLVTAVGSWLVARSTGGEWLLRMDDLDRPRVIAGMADDIMQTLEAFGLYWDGAVSWQSKNTDAYRAAFDQLQGLGQIYPCGCSRKEIARTASAPHPDNDCLHYSGVCRNGLLPGMEIRSWRVKSPTGPICFHDLHCGEICQDLASSCGDFALRRGDGEFAYQLAVVVDDQLSGVNQVVRGNDLLGSTGRQIHLQRLLGLAQPDYCHLPLVTGPDGAKLSKRDNLISESLEGVRGRESSVLAAALDFLGQRPPADLLGAGCGELLEWARKNFSLARIPHSDRALPIYQE